ncbi:M20/M25/M40 family metallo-hydrolase [Streptomyces sp. MJP52]|uniref:M20 family metallopeptidase n=1 Tax=Streptomyces sp. MJP52 TaxID=2940555 RepID=UPI0024747D38|nr:M20/M25/M40 family metallo-hydrolase [Streptomyces sp. MJP52]MDH6228633.1 succinyl-diaminopimelate desuccinylase [Streptomyces sp. MJP52]
MDDVRGSVVALARELVRTPSRGGTDDHGPVLDVLERWLTGRGLPHRRLRGPDGTTAGLLVEVAGGRPGEWWTLDACVDTAPFGDEGAWSFPPTAGDVVDGWLRGRGAADSKTAAAMFCHLAADLAPRAGELAGGLAVLLDADEHTGRFGGARAYLADPRARRPAGVMIGYPGIDEVVVGGRGLWRCILTVRAPSGHSGARREVVGAVSRAAHLVRMLDGTELPGDSFPLPPRLTVTAIDGGEGFSVVPDRCRINVDVRTTAEFGPPEAERLVRAVVSAFDAGTPGPGPTDVEPVISWPAYRLDGDRQPAAALLRAAADAGLEVRAKVAGPSNIGNLLAGEGVPATAGFGLPHQGLHGTDERVDLAELPRVYGVYRRAVLRLLGGP